MNLDIASASDAAELSKFYKSFTSSGLVEYKIDRKDDFFAPYRIQSDDFRSYILRDDEGIHGVASFVFKDAMINNEKRRIAYASDLRVANNRRVIMEWSKHFLPVLKDVMSKEARHVFSAINMQEISAINTFIRPRSMRRPMPRYYLYRKFHLVTLHGRFPWAKPPVSSIRFKPADENSLEALATYLSRRSSYRPFSTQWDLESFQNKLARFSGMKLSDIRIAYDSEGNIIGCSGTYPGKNIQNIIPLSYSLRAHNFRQFLKFLWVFTSTRKLTKPVASTGKENPFSFRHLCFLHADNETIFEGLLWHNYLDSDPSEFLVYAHCDNDYRLNPPKDWIAAKMPFSLYSVTPPEDAMPDFLDPSISLNPELESAFLI